MESSSVIHQLLVRVYFEDTDFSGFAYHGSYVRFLERGRTEFLRATNIDQGALFAADGFIFVVVRMTLEFRKPARMDDELTVVTEPLECRGATMDLRQSVRRGDEVLVEAHVVVAATRHGRATRIPDHLRGAMLKQVDV
jgi:acyl-CoA thioester hydrolase